MTTYQAKQLKTLGYTGWILLLVSWFIPASHAADAPASGIYTHSVQQPFESAFETLKQALEDKQFFVVLEPDMGSRMAKFAETWGKDYNRNQIEHIRGMVFCNIWQTNHLGNQDPKLLGLCPLHLTMIHQRGITTVLLPRLSLLAVGSAGASAVQELEQELIGIIQQALPIPKP